MRSPVLRLAVLSLALGAATVEAADLAQVLPGLERAVERAMDEGEIPSCALALVTREATVWSGAYGRSNLWASTPATTDTVYLIGSTFKPLVMMAALQLVEAGRLELDAPVREVLPELEIRGEDPERPVTLRHLLTHTSGLPAAFGGHDVWGDSVPPPIDETLRRSLELTVPTGAQVVYSNLGFTLVAHLIERLSGLPFRRYVEERLFGPLGMTSTVFTPTPELAERLAVPYVDRGDGRQVAARRLKADVWPAGIVYGTVEDQARWLRAVLRGGELDGERVLSEASVVASLERQYDRFAGPMHAGWGDSTAGFGLAWWTARREGRRRFAHSGSVPGYTAFVEGDYDAGVGVAILTNGNAAHVHLVSLAEEALRLLRRTLR